MTIVENVNWDITLLRNRCGGSDFGFNTVLLLMESDAIVSFTAFDVAITRNIPVTNRIGMHIS